VDVVVNDSGSESHVSPSFSTEKPPNDSSLEDRVLFIADQLMERRYVLDLDDLYKECIRVVRDVEKRHIENVLSDLTRRKVLIHGKALTRQVLLENPYRKQILELVKREPGLHFSRIKACINKESRTVQWHLRMLEKFDFIREERFGNNVVYFDFLQDKQHDRLHYYLHKEGAPAILMAILNHPGITIAELIEQLQMPRSTLARKINVLVVEGIVTVSYKETQVMCVSIVEGIVPVLQKALKTGVYT